MIDIAAGTGNLKTHSQRGHVRELRAAASGRARRAADLVSTRTEARATRTEGKPGPGPSDFEALGIGVEVVKLSAEQAAAAGWPIAGVDSMEGNRG